MPVAVGYAAGNCQAMNLVKQPYQPLPLLAVTAEAEEQRNALVLSALAVKQVTTVAENTLARDAVVAMRQHLKSVESASNELSQPLRDATAKLKALADDHNGPLTVEIDRLQRLATVFDIEEQARQDADEKARQELMAEAVTGSDVEAIAVDPLPKARGQRNHESLRWEVTDIDALYRARPDLCRLEPKASAIQALCIPEMPNLPPGLKLWWEKKTIFTTR